MASGGETVRDLVVRLKIEQSGISDIKMPDFRAGSNGQRDFNRAVKEGAPGIREQLKDLFDTKRALADRLQAIKDSIPKERALADAANLNAEAQRKLTLAYKRQYDLGIVETVNRLARAYSFLAAAQGENAEKMARTILLFQGAFDAGRGLAETLARLRNLYHGLAAAVLAYNTAAAAGGAARFAGLGGAAGGLAAGAAGIGAAGLGIATNPITLALVGGGVVGSGLIGARRDFESGDRSFFTNLIDGIRGMMGGVTRDSALQSGLNSLKMSLDKLDTRLGQQQQEFGLQRGLAGLQGSDAINALRSGFQDRLANAQRRFTALDGSSPEALVARDKVAREIFQLQKQTQDLLMDEQRIKQESSREAIRSEEQRLQLIERELRNAERIAEMTQTQIDRSVTAFAGLNSFEQRRALGAADSLRGGKKLSDRDRDLLERVGSEEIRNLLLQRDTEEARQGGFFGSFAKLEQQRLAEANRTIQERQRLADQSERSIAELKEQAETVGEEIAKQTRIMAESLLEGFRRQLEADRAAQGAIENAQKIKAGL